MSIKEPIIIIEDDMDDQEVMALIFKELGIDRGITFFNNGQDAYEYLLNDQIVPFIIFSDINMPGMNGFQLRDKIHESDGLRMKCVPYLFLTTGGDSKFVWEAYSKSAQGYFVKPSTMDGWRQLVSTIINYWQNSKKPLALLNGF